MAKARVKSQTRSLKKKSGVPEGLASELGLFFRPERFRYLKRVKAKKGCVFCDCASAGVGATQLVLGQTEQAFIVLNKYPYNSGHLMVIPNRHIASLADLSEAEVIELSLLQRFCTKVLEEELQCQGVNVGLNQGVAAGAGIPDHLHWHLVPRWGGDTNFFPLLAQTKVLPMTNAQVYRRLKPYFKELNKKGIWNG